ncbi:MAG: hypothetical protein DI564_06415 [Rhodanobacter denitrificans]|uniref:Protein kinase domain-containing protein n=1 Tax=Rhodanobacter denitrificans TaxID=666685 RepID=A0A2W5KKJ6_9GAMM|nr:MAG: hypothetical protein DI564_06415 [Rhodanobacter denitrificans]
MIDASIARHRDGYARFRRLFDLAGADREAALAAIAREDPAAADALRAMLAEAEAQSDEATAPDRSGQLLDGRFRLLRRLGGGGMGEVYLAERTDEARQWVAVKLLRAEVPAARALRERRILARLRHRHIAGLVDAGLSADGRPWFAMDYVEGEPITDACDRRQLGLADRARLLAAVARAVQFAHRNLVLHRDLKPSNILVDGDGAPRLLDFGVAKLLDGGAEAQDTQTLGMTPAYASPEQRNGEPVTTASDVYQLGLVLYELASGIAAHKARAVAGPATGELPRPDQAFAGLARRDPARAGRIAQARGRRADRLGRALRGDLARIVAKATAVLPHERYDTAQALAEDLDRWASGLPVAAHRGTFAYRLGKRIRRHAVATAAIATLAIGLAVSTGVAVHRARIEQQQREQADRQRQRAETLLGFLRDVFREAEPNATSGATLDAAELLRRAGHKLETDAQLETATHGVLATELAAVFASLGQRADALAAAERAEHELRPLRRTHPIEYLRSVEVLAVALREAHRNDELIARADEALTLADTTFDPQRRWRAVLLRHRASALIGLSRLDEAEANLRAALSDLREAGMDRGEDLASTLNELANLAFRRGDATTALALLQRQKAAIDTVADRDRLNALLLDKNIAQVHLQLLGDARTALTILEPVCAELDSLVGAAHDRTIEARLVLVSALLADGRVRQAARLLDEQDRALDGRLDGLHPGIRLLRLQLKVRLALLDGDPGHALALLHEGLRPGDPKVQTLQWLLGEVLLRNGRIAEARTQLAATLAELTARDGPPDALQANVHDSLGRVALLAGDVAEATIELDTAIDQFRTNQGPDSPGTLRSELHRLWLRATTSDAAGVLEDMKTRRTALARLVDADAPQLRQADRLITAGMAASVTHRPQVQRSDGAGGATADDRRRLDVGLDPF